jgi:hypothetical protein
LLQDAWLDARARMLEFGSHHGDLLWAGVVAAIVAFFVYRWRSAR